MKKPSLNKTERSGYTDKALSAFWRRYWAASALLLAIICAPAFASAVTLISQSFVSSSNLPVGSIVSLQKDSSTNVVSADNTNTNNILGVVVSSSDSQVSISSTNGTQVQVVTNGVEQVLVSDINGSIAVGDPITSSPISGVGMKATENSKVVGIAQDKFPNTTVSKQTYKDKGGKTHTATIGQVPVLVNVAYYYKQPNKTLIPSAIQNIANALAGKPVNSLPIIISIAIFIVTLVIVVGIVYALIHSSIISVGRNPMSQAAVYRNVIQLSGLVLVILAVAVVSIYMVLTRV